MNQRKTSRVTARPGEEGVEKYLKNWRSLAQMARDHVSEGRDIEFKRDPYGHPKKPDEVRRQETGELCRDFTAMANGGGGWLIIGMEEEADRAHSLVGVEEPRRYEDSTKKTLIQWVRPKLTSRAFSVTVIPAQRDSGKGALIVRIEPSVAGRPMAAIINDRAEFWIRTGRDKRPMEYAEIGEGFEPSDDETNRVADSVAAQEVRKIRWAIESTRSGAERDWARASELLDQLVPYANECGIEVCREAVAAAGAIVDHTRWGLPDGMAEQAGNVITLALYSAGFHRADVDAKVPKRQLEMATEVIGRAWSLVWDGTRYLKDVAVVYEGIQLMLVVLHWSRKHHIQDLPARILDDLAHARVMAVEKKSKSVVALIDWATSGDVGKLRQSNDLPEELARLIFKG